MATKTSSAIADPARSYPVGVVAKSVVFVGAGATFSASDTIQMVNVPNKAIILEMILTGNTRNTNTVVKVGDGGDDDRFITAQTLSSTDVMLRLNAATGLGFQISLTDDAIPQSDTIDMVIQSTASATATGSYHLIVMYYNPPA